MRPAETDPPRVLAVDDVPEVLYVRARVLRKAGFEVWEAHTGARALELAEAQPDLVVLDVHLPDMHGFDVCRRLREGPRTAYIPVLHVSATQVDDQMVARGLDTGADAYLTEPVDPRVLVSTARALIRMRAAEAAARRAEAEQRALFEQVNDAIVVFEPGSETILDANPAAARLYGFEPGELVGHSIKELSRDVARGEQQVRQLLADGAMHNFASVHLRRDGTPVELLISASVIEWRGRTAVLTVNRDVTELHRMQRLVAQARRVESLATMAGGLAHDFNTILTVIMGHVSLLRPKLPNGHAGLAHVDAIAEAASRAAELSGRMLSCSGGGSFQLTLVDLGALVAEMRTGFEAGLPAGVRLETIVREAPPVEGDPSQLRQVLGALVDNAREAVGARPGRIRIGVEARTLAGDEEVLWQVTGLPLPAGSYTAVTVDDDGSGIEPAVLPRIFDPFFTTRFTGRGLGLPAALGIVRGLRGAIAVTSETGRGTRVEVVLPASAGPSSPRR